MKYEIFYEKYPQKVKFLVTSRLPSSPLVSKEAALIVMDRLRDKIKKNTEISTITKVDF